MSFPPDRKSWGGKTISSVTFTSSAYVAVVAHVPLELSKPTITSVS